MIDHQPTAGETVYRYWNWRGFGYRSDMIDFDYMRRRIFYTPFGCIRLHHILRGDSDRHFHDHPFHFLSFILKGGYIEHRPKCKPTLVMPGDSVFRLAKDLHYLKLVGGSTWTLVFATNPIRRWGFATEDGWIDARDYDEWLAKRPAADGVPRQVPYSGASK